MANAVNKTDPYVTPSLKSPVIPWVLWCGIMCCAVAVLCMVLTGAFMTWNFDAVAQSPTPSASELAEGVNWAMIPAIGVVPIGLVGLVLVVVGLVVQQVNKN